MISTGDLLDVDACEIIAHRPDLELRLRYLLLRIGQISPVLVLLLWSHCAGSAPTATLRPIPTYRNTSDASWFRVCLA
ncbi:hypothetical protein TIFTF001_012467 [Ficus carica]|uniref:Uncharacterized protein n=1 Tax=Ficus carica TaxID=3494 RepID=A0AA88D589_FICCA|nr:hypothetical protein TIFTF001_012467 [Ficus carica]